MHLTHPIDTIAPGPRGAILERLAATFEPLTGNQIAELSGGRVSQSSASRVLPELVRSGLVTARPAGRAILYELNRRHLLAPAVEVAVSAGDRLVDHLRESVARWDVPPVALWLFGSAARGEASDDSDVDLLVVKPTITFSEDAWEQQLATLADDVGALSGNACEILEYSLDELNALAAAGDPLIDSLRAEAVALTGERPTTLLKEMS